MRLKHSWKHKHYEVEKIDGCDSYLVFVFGVFTTVFPTLRKAKNYVAKYEIKKANELDFSYETSEVR